ncbi:hypothetical protein B0H14DRAFT_3518527 [Mycena olivaceomarginata]|nr:hypothetical protein B0H14DRAFT_3518527 [Mycena olivaceomarginata]
MPTSATAAPPPTTVSASPTPALPPASASACPSPPRCCLNSAHASCPVHTPLLCLVTMHRPSHPVPPHTARLSGRPAPACMPSKPLPCRSFPDDCVYTARPCAPTHIRATTPVLSRLVAASTLRMLNDVLRTKPKQPTYHPNTTQAFPK